MFCAKIAQQRRQQSGRSTVDGADPEFSSSSQARAIAQIALDRLDAGEDGTGIAQQRRAIFRQRHRTRRPREQPRVQILLQQLDLAAECGGQHLEMLRRAAEMQLLGRRHEASQLMQFHSRSSDPVTGLYHFFV
ncbi:hypothetical protein ACVWZW_006186 [Bradyrhizobium sp. F1.13.4]